MYLPKIKAFFFAAIIFSSFQLYAQDSTKTGKFLKYKIKNGEVIEGKIIGKEGLSTRLQLKDGKTVKVPDSLIAEIDSTSREFDYEVSEKTVALELNSGEVIKGKITSVSDTSVTIKTFDDIIMIIPDSKIHSTIKLNEEFPNSSFYRKDPNQSHLFFGPTAEPIESGQVYFSDYMIFFPTLNVGIANIVSAGGGISLIPIAKGQIYYFSIKATLLNQTLKDDDNLSLAVGGMTASILTGYTETQGIFYGAATFRKSFFSLTSSIMLTTGKSNKKDIGILLFGGELRLSNSIKFIIENYLFSNNNPALFSFGIRFFGDTMAGDFGLITSANMMDAGSFPFIPWLAFTYNF